MSLLTTRTRLNLIFGAGITLQSSKVYQNGVVQCDIRVISTPVPTRFDSCHGRLSNGYNDDIRILADDSVQSEHIQHLILNGMGAVTDP